MQRFNRPALNFRAEGEIVRIGMYLPKIHRQPVFFQIPQTTLPRRPEFPLKFNPSSSSRLLSSSLSKPSFRLSSIPNAEASIVKNKKEKADIDVFNSLSEFDDLAPDGDVYLNTLRLVECSMFAAVTGLVYFLSNSLSIEVCLRFPLPTLSQWWSWIFLTVWIILNWLVLCYWLTGLLHLEFSFRLFKCLFIFGA